MNIAEFLLLGMKVSVIIATFNREKYIGRAIRSLLEQSWPKENYEIIVINDGSKDNTAAILNAFGNSIKTINLEKNTGLPCACNLGIKKALGQYVVRIDDDDYVHEDFLKTLYNFLSMNKHFDAAACDYHVINETEEVLERKNVQRDPIACGILFKKDDLVDIGLYDEKFLFREDEDLRIRYLSKYKIRRIELPLYRYTKHKDNMTNNRIKMGNYKKRLEKKHKNNKRKNKKG